MTAFGRIVYRVWCATCIALASALIAVRWLAYTPLADTPALGPVLREAMVVNQQAFLWPWAYTAMKARILMLIAAVLMLGLHRRLRAHVLDRHGGRWRLRPVAVAVVVGALAWVQYLFDVNPTIAVVGAFAIGLAAAAESPVLASVPRAAWIGVWSVALLVVLASAGSVADRVALVVLALVLAIIQRWLAPRTGRRDLTLARLAVLLPLNLVPALLPAIAPLHGGAPLGDELAYGFCEVPNRGILYASIPVCGSIRTHYEDCRDGRVFQYDLATMTRIAEHRFFSPTFFGRLEQLVCLDDEVQVAVQGAVYQGRPVIQGVLAFPIDAPQKFGVLTTERGIGTTIAYDAAHDALFYSGEFDNPLVRYDRTTHEFDDTPSAALARRWYEPITLKANNGSLAVQTKSIHPGRNRIYLADWMQGRWAYAVDLTTLRLVQRYEVGGGGAMGITVDPERDRLFVSSMWGLEVIDLTTDRVIARIRTGLGNRPVIVDPVRNRLYLTSTLEGTLRVLDRDSLAVLAKIPMGFGSRYAHLSLDGTRLFASSLSSHYYWDPDTLVPTRDSRP